MIVNSQEIVSDTQLINDCDRPLGPQITAAGLLVFGGIFIAAGLGVRNLGSKNNSSYSTQEYNDSQGGYVMLEYFCYGLGGAALSVSVILELVSIKRWKEYKKCKKSQPIKLGVKFSK